MQRRGRSRRRAAAARRARGPRRRRRRGRRRGGIRSRGGGRRRARSPRRGRRSRCSPRPSPRGGGRGTRSGSRSRRGCASGRAPSVPSSRCSRPPRLPMIMPRAATACRLPSGATAVLQRRGSRHGGRSAASGKERMEIRRAVQPELRPAARRAARPSWWCCTIPRCRRAEAALERLCDPAAEVSAHYLIAEDGRVWRLVDEEAAGVARGGRALGRGGRRELALDRDRAGQCRAARGLPAVSRAADGGARGVARRGDGALGHPARRGDRPFRHGAGAQGRSGAEVRLAAAGAGRAGDLGRTAPRGRGRVGGVPRGGAGGRLRRAGRRLGAVLGGVAAALPALGGGRNWQPEDVAVRSRRIAGAAAPLH